MVYGEVCGLIVEYSYGTKAEENILIFSYLCFRRILPYFGRAFLRLNYIYMTKNTYILS